MVVKNKPIGIPAIEDPLVKYKNEDEIAKKRFPFTQPKEFIAKKDQDQDFFFAWCEIRRNAILSGNPQWHKYDSLMKQLMFEMNSHLLQETPHYTVIDWKWIKAMAWTETGATNEQWNSNVMQIGVNNDPGIFVVTKRKGTAEIVTPSNPKWKNLSETKIKTIPEINIRAAIIYLMNSLSISNERSVKKPCLAPLSVTVSKKKGLATLDDIRRKKNTTKEVLEEMNNIPHYLHDGDILKYVPAEKKRVILGWNLPINAQRIALAYNGGGDYQYIEKIKYCYSLITSMSGRI